MAKRAMTQVECAARQVLEVLTRLGAPPMSKRDWIELLELVRDGCIERMELTRAELERGEDDEA